MAAAADRVASSPLTHVTEVPVTLQVSWRPGMSGCVIETTCPTSLPRPSKVPARASRSMEPRYSGHRRFLQMRTEPRSPSRRRGSPSTPPSQRCSAWSPRCSGPWTRAVEEIAARLDIGRLAVYAMLEQGLLPGIRLGRRWIITRHAYEEWEHTCGMPTGSPVGTGFRPDFEVTV